MTGSSNEPASRPDASRNCADHPEEGQDPSDTARGQVQRLCDENDERGEHLVCQPQVQGSTKHADQDKTR